MDVLVKSMARDEPLLVVGLVNTETVEKARAIHDTYPTATAALGRVISGALLLSSLLKEEQKVIIQVKGDGPLREIVAESDWLCRVRGYVKRPHIHLELRNNKFNVGRALGSGFFYVIKDLGIREPYHGSVPLQTGEIAEDLAYYLSVSEQIPAAVSLGVFVDTDNRVKASGGFMIHALPGTSDAAIDHLETRLKRVPPVSSSILKGLSPEEIMERAVGMPVEILERKNVLYSCPCNKKRVVDVIVALGRKDIEKFIRKKETVKIRCRFCGTQYDVTKEEMTELLKGMA